MGDHGNIDTNNVGEHRGNYENNLWERRKAPAEADGLFLERPKSNEIIGHRRRSS